MRHSGRAASLFVGTTVTPTGRTILFVCQDNSARSQAAEALAKHFAIPEVLVLSAGISRTRVSEEVILALCERRVDFRGQYSKTLETLASGPIDDVIALCEEVRLPSAKLFPASRHHFWPLEDPIAFPDASSIPDRVRITLDFLSIRIAEWFQQERLRRTGR